MAFAAKRWSECVAIGLPRTQDWQSEFSSGRGRTCSVVPAVMKNVGIDVLKLKDEVRLSGVWGKSKAHARAAVGFLDSDRPVEPTLVQLGLRKASYGHAPGDRQGKRSWLGVFGNHEFLSRIRSTLAIRRSPACRTKFKPRAGLMGNWGGESCPGDLRIASVLRMRERNS